MDSSNQKKTPACNCKLDALKSLLLAVAEADGYGRSPFASWLGCGVGVRDTAVPTNKTSSKAVRWDADRSQVRFFNIRPHL